MDFFPSPPSSPTPSDLDKVMCGECEKPLASDWFCSDCHKKCEHCNRFLTNEPCSRCWVYDTYQHLYVRKPPLHFQPPTYFHPMHSEPYFYNQHQHYQQPSPPQQYQVPQRF